MNSRCRWICCVLFLVCPTLTFAFSYSPPIAIDYTAMRMQQVQNAANETAAISSLMEFLESPATTSCTIEVPKDTTLDETFAKTLGAAALSWAILSADSKARIMTVLPQFELGRHDVFNPSSPYLSTVKVLPAETTTVIQVTLCAKKRFRSQSLSWFINRLKQDYPSLVIQ
ncbi:MAG: hypothetical protein AB7F28_02875 [Candidatus Margulisiibacteriota bacterium]